MRTETAERTRAVPASEAKPIRPGAASLAVLLAVLLWASSFVGIRAALGAYPPEHLALLRYVVASAVLLAIAPLARIRRPAWRDLPGAFLTGLIGIAVYNVALNHGERTVTAGAASMIINTVPVLTAALSTLFLRERLGRVGWVGLTVSLGGVALIAFTSGSGVRLDPGAGLLLIAALSMSVYFVLQKPYLGRYSPLEMVAYAIWSGTLCLLVFLPGLVTTIRDADAASTAAVVYLGVFPAAVAYVAYSYGLAAMPAGRTASFLYLVPVLTIAIAWLWLREVPPARALIGGVVVMGGVALVNAARASVRRVGGAR